MDPDVVAFEFFSVLSVIAGRYTFYGLRSASTIDGILTVDCGYMTPGMPPDGEVIIVFPSKNALGESGKLILTLSACRWNLSLDSGGYPNGGIFRYTATVDREAEFKIEFENDNTPGELIKVVDL